MCRVNLGDYLTEAILGYMGHEFIPYGSGQEFDNDGCLLAVGSLLGSWDFFDAIKGPIDVWGTGARGPSVDSSNLSVHCVRGPKTAELLNVDVPLGDPALLLPRWIVKGQEHGKSLYIPHCSSINFVTNDEVEWVGADEVLDTTCFRHEVEEAIRRISGSDFVLTGSLHGAIIAQAYDVPWAFCFPKGRKVVMPFRLQDWCSYLGIEPQLVDNLAHGKLWWERHGRHGKLRDTEQILQSFPY